MFDYIAINAATANWLLAQDVRKTAIAASLERIANFESLTAGVLTLGPLRIAATKQSSVVTLWNVDLLTGKGYERWGFCRMSGDGALLGIQEILQEVFERFLAITDLRMNGLKLEDRMIHRHIEDDLHTCLAGRGSVARQFSLAFSDKAIEFDGAKIPALIAVGPVETQLGNVPMQLKIERKKIGMLVQDVTKMVSSVYLRPALDTSALHDLKVAFQPATQVMMEFGQGLPCVPALSGAQSSTDKLTSKQWMAPGGPLSSEQRAILESDVILKSPIRVIGPAGSGKTLLMQLLAIRRIEQCELDNSSCKIGYIVHNAAMMQSVRERFQELGCNYSVVTEKSKLTLEVITLNEYSTRALESETVPVIDTDAYQTKKCQIELVLSYLKESIDAGLITKELHPLLGEVARSSEVVVLFAELLVAEFGVAIKGNDLSNNKQGYVLSEASLSRLHAVLNVEERSVVFDVFSKYQHCVAEDFQALDADDLAITVLGKVTTPLWRLKRKTIGYDFLFVDEAQLFNENERRLFPFLTKGDRGYVPIVLALDEAQAIHGLSGAGLGALGFGDLSNESLNSVFRSTPSILRLAFHVIQKSTDLFGPDFPNFTRTSLSLIPDNHHLAKPPVLLLGGQARSPGNFIVKVVGKLRSANLRQVAVVVFSDRYWSEVRGALNHSRLPVQELTTRGDKVDARKPIVVLTKPEYIGGQEFDAVVCVGLEEGVSPPDVGGNHTLAASFAQRVLREMYVSFTRARYRLVIANSTSSNLSPLLKDAQGKHLFEEKPSDWL